MKNIFFGAGILAALLSPAAAYAAEGFATANVNMRSGPSTYYPAVTVIPIGEPIEIHGCLAEVAWCDVSFFGGRGWVSGRYVQAAYDDDRVYLEPRYYRPLGIPTITFEFGTYWDRNYRGRDFYREREYWRRGPGYARDNDRYERERRRSSRIERDDDDDDFEFESSNRRARERAERLERQRAEERQLQRSERRQRERAERRDEQEQERRQLERQRDRESDRAERRRRDRNDDNAVRSRQRDESRSERRQNRQERERVERRRGSDEGGSDNRRRRRCVEGQPNCE